jgi:DNA adenine methylase
VVNFFRGLRDNTDELMMKLRLTPYSREEFGISLEKDEITDPIERARLFYVKMKQAFVAADDKTRKSEWFYATRETRRGIARAVGEWLIGVEMLPEIASRLLMVQIEDKNALKLIPKLDSKNALIYCDPPYFPDSFELKGMYKYSMDEEKHRELSEILHSCEGKVAISGYSSPMAEKLYGNWKMFEAPVRQTSPLSSWKIIKKEILWTNYNPSVNRIRKVRKKRRL